MQQVSDFLQECEVLFELVSDLPEADFELETQFKAWTINDVFVHLHFWDKMVDLTLHDESSFGALAKEMQSILMQDGFRRHENARVEVRGRALVDAWIGQVRKMAVTWSNVDPKRRLPWIGPSMSARSSMTARQMETWAHGCEVFDRLGKTRIETNRIKNIVVLGVNTFAWTHQVHTLPVPPQMPELKLTAPTGEIWQFGEPNESHIAGPAVDFASVVTQTRAFADTELIAHGKAAVAWMEHAQCFAGSAQMPPKPGSRHRRTDRRS